MPRASFSDVSKGGMGFQEGRMLILTSIATMFQYPPNSKSGKQSDPFPALVWRGHKLNNSDGKPVEDAEGNIEEVEIAHRMGAMDEAGHFAVRPGRLDAKDFDNLDMEPTDLGVAVDVVGNSFVVDDGTKFPRSWGFMEDSLRKLSFKPEILGRLVTTDFVGMDAHFKTQAGEKFIAKKGENKGKEVSYDNLVCDRIYTFPYDAKVPAANQAAGAGKAAGAAAQSTGAKGAGQGKVTPGTTPGANGHAQANTQVVAAGGGTSGEDETLIEAKVLFADLSSQFKSDFPAGKEFDRVDFQKGMTKELMRKKLNPKTQTAIMNMIKSDAGLVTIAMETGALVLDDVDKPTKVALA